MRGDVGEGEGDIISMRFDGSFRFPGFSCCIMLAVKE